MKQLILFFALSILTIPIIQAQSDEGVIYWDADRPLVWADFKGKPINTSPYHAQTQGALNYSFDSKGGGNYLFTLNVKFDKQKSWRKPEEETDNLLTHEQGHFDIYEIYARMIIKNIKEQNALNGSKFSDRIEKIFRRSFGEMEKFQHKYDTETKHSKDEEKQKEWNKKLEKMLKNLEKYKVKDIEFKV